jgi:hypothetical protein
VDLEEGLFLRKTGESGKEESSNYELEKERWFLLPEKASDKAYVDWFQFVAMVLQWRELEKNLARINHLSPEGNPIVKVWLFKTWRAFQDLGRAAFIPAEYPSLLKTELESVPLDSIMIGISKGMEFNHRFLTSR